MAQGGPPTAVTRLLFRSMLRWSKQAEGQPFTLRQGDVVAACPALRDTAFDADDAVALQRLTRWGFREYSVAQGEAAALAQDRGLQALRVLNTYYAEKLQRARATRAEKSDRTGVLYSVGQVFTHKKHGYTGVIYGWDRTCDRNDEWAEAMGVNPRQPFYSVLPDERDCQRLFRAIRMTKYVAQDNINVVAPQGRVVHRALHHYFSCYSEELGRYLPNRQLQYEYPDCYASACTVPCAADSNLLLHDEEEREPACPQEAAARQVAAARAPAKHRGAEELHGHSARCAMNAPNPQP